MVEPTPSAARQNMAVYVPNLRSTAQTQVIKPTPEAGPAPVARVELPYEGLSSLDENIAFCDVIVRARLASVTGAVDQAKNWIDQTTIEHYSMLKFNFQVLEYLAGSGSATVVGVGIGDRYTTKQEAQAALPGLISSRDTKWDDREAIVFMRTYKRFPITRLADHYLIATLRGVDGDNYTVASLTEKLWLPEDTTPSAAKSAEKRFLLDDPGNVASTLGSGSATPTITIAALKKRMGPIQAKIDAGDGSLAYRKCVGFMYLREREIRWMKEGLGLSAIKRYDLDDLSSGQPPTDVYGTWRFGGVPDKTGRYWLEGPDSDLFQVQIANIGSATARTPGDIIEYDVKIDSQRPLVAGDYEFYLNSMSPARVLCNEYSELERNLDRMYLTVTAPSGTLHEAFFDPVTVGVAIAADATNGVLKPASFNDTNSASATIQQISWVENTVEMILTPHTGLANHVLDFIALNGSVILSLDADEATVDAANNRLTWWPVTPQPWKDGDKLMVRIHDGP